MERDAKAVFVVHPAAADGPAVVDITQSVDVWHSEVGEEFLGELPRAVYHLNSLDFDPGLMDREHKDGEPPVLWYVPVGTGEAKRPVAPPGAGGPDLGAVQHPL